MQTITLEKAVALIPDGATIMIGGFMAVGTPERLMDELVRQGKKDLTVIANDNALPGKGVGKQFSGTYFVTDTTHTLNDSGYTTAFTARREQPLAG